MKSKILMALALALPASPLMAEGIEVEPGLWKLTTTLNMPMLPQPQTTTIEQCIEDSTFNVEDISTDGLDPNCTFEVTQLDASTMKWSMQCPVEGGGTSQAEWQATSAGDSVEGSGSIRVAVMGQEMEMTTRFSGQHIGACP